MSDKETRTCPNCDHPVVLPDYFWAYEIHGKQLSCTECGCRVCVKTDEQVVYEEDQPVDSYDIIWLEETT